MYQKSILKSLIGSQGNLKVMAKIQKRVPLIFPGMLEQSFFRVLNSYTEKHGYLPSQEYLEDFFDGQKDDPAKELFNSVMDPSVRLIPEQELMSYVDMQRTHNSKRSLLDSVEVFEARAKTCNLNDIPQIATGFLDQVSTVARGLYDLEGRSSTLYGDDSIREIRKDYEERKKGGGTSIAKFGIPELDLTTGGLRRDDWVTIAAYTSHGKSMMWRYLMYKFLSQGLNVFAQTYEMSYGTVRDQLLCLHANNTEIWGWGRPSIPFRRIVNGQLDPQQEEFYLNEVVPDFTKNQNYGILHLEQPAEGAYTWEDSLSDLRACCRYEFPVDVYMVDYVTMMRPNRKGRCDREDYDEMIRNLRLSSLSEGIPVVTPHQCNRKSFEEASKDKKHLYTLACLSDYHEMERSSTVAFSLYWTDEMRNAGVSQIQSLKHREGSLFQTHNLSLNPTTGHYFPLNVAYNQDDTLEIIDAINTII